MAIQIPSDEEIRLAVAEVFDRVRFGHTANLLNALVVVDNTMHQGCSIINYVVDYEMRELCDFVNGFNTHLKQTDNRYQRARIKALIYCHVMEADLPLTVIWNLLRILDGEACDWTFRRIAKTKRGDKEVVCEYPHEKVAELKRLSKKCNVQIGIVLDRLWQRDLRNAFSHSQYCWMGDIFTATNFLSPLSRKKGGKKGNPSFTFDDIECLYQGVKNLLYYFTEAYQVVIAPFRDGNAHPVDSGSIVWDSQSGWLWEGNV